MALVPKSTTIVDYKQNRPAEADRNFEEVKRLGIAGLENGTLIYLKKIQTRAFNVTHPNSNFSRTDISLAKNAYQSLNKLIQKFLGTSLDRNQDGDPILFGKEIPMANLSNGQIIILQLCVQIHSQGASLDNLVITIDEPENHLHPEASIDMISSIIDAAPNCQIWIATHSLPILSYFDDATLLFVEDGKVNYAGNTPESVLNNLIGGDERVQKLRDFTSLPSVYAMNRYAAECLKPPAVVGAQEKDDQTKQIQNHITEIQKTIAPRSLRLLDYGAGKGRLLESLTADTNDLANTVDYVAFDEYLDDADTCKKVISAAYQDSKERHFTKISDLTTKFSKKYFDVIVMCNVLHEIDPKDWLNMFGAHGSVTSLLSDNGVLLLVEDEEIPIGEKAYAKGFIVFDTTELRDLFKIEPDEELVYSDQRNNGRLKAHIIEQKWLKRVTADSRIDALKERQRRARKEIIELRKAGPDYKNGRKHSFWVQQLANSDLALSELSN